MRLLMQASRGWALVACLLGALVTVSAAQAERQRPPEESCAEGWYTGPREGRKSYSNDKYLWVVTADFAKRFCMPPEFVDKGLKGAEAVAFRMSTSTGGFDRCAIIDGKEECSGDNELRFDIFLRSDLNLPAANPEVKFYDGSRDDAGGHIAVDEGLPTRAARYSAGKYHLPPGTIPHFRNPFSFPDEGVPIYLVGVQEGKVGWVIADLYEWRYEASWTRDFDLLVIQANPAPGVFQEMREVQSYAIVFGHRNDTSKVRKRRVPEEFTYTIWLPDKFFQKVRAAVGDKSLIEQMRLYQRQ